MLKFVLLVILILKRKHGQITSYVNHGHSCIQVSEEKYIVLLGGHEKLHGMIIMDFISLRSLLGPSLL